MPSSYTGISLGLQVQKAPLNYLLIPNMCTSTVVKVECTKEWQKEKKILMRLSVFVEIKG